MHSMIIRYRVGDGPEQTEQLTSDVATLDKALEWAPQQMALRLMRDGVIKTGAEMTTVAVAPAVEIPAEVRDNSETVTDYAFMRHLSQSDWPYGSIAWRDQEIGRVDMFPRLSLTHYQWHDVNPDGQRCRFDMIVNANGDVVNLFHTEYWTRVTCQPCMDFRAQSYAAHYAEIITEDGTPFSDEPVPICDDHLYRLTRNDKVTARLSERLLIGQHD